MTDKWQDLQNDIGAFTDKTFGKSTPQAKLHHLAEEVQELLAEPEDHMEWADCFILLLDAANKAGLSMDDVYEAIEAKMEINKSRTWGEPDENGVVKHVG